MARVRPGSKWRLGVTLLGLCLAGVPLACDLINVGPSTACSEHADCRLAPAVQCCAACEPVDASDFIPMNRDAFESRPQCTSGCGACAQPPEVEWRGAYFVPRCIENHCQTVDLREQHVDCTKDEDCFLREGNGCCESCFGDGYIAVSSLAFVSDLACPEVSCPSCDLPPPEGLSAKCNTETNRCEKVQD